MVDLRDTPESTNVETYRPAIGKSSQLNDASIRQAQLIERRRRLRSMPKISMQETLRRASVSVPPAPLLTGDETNGQSQLTDFLMRGMKKR